MSGATRIQYEPDEWTPGDPLYVRPLSNIGGNHVRQLIQLVEIPGYRGDEYPTEDGRLVWVDSELRNTSDKSCSCADRTRWPEPLKQCEVGETDEIAYRLARQEEQERGLAS